ncbi:MAG: hypothetical protein HY608_07905 [Planctomycetes bacterium]|nr:hypothetical protein [Planctomycetota bacterium]
MNRAARRSLAAGAVLGGVAGLLLAGGSPAGAGTPGAQNPDGGEILTASLSSVGGGDLLLVVDPVQYSIAIYDTNNQNRLMLLRALRYYGWDLLLESFPSSGHEPRGGDKNKPYGEMAIPWSWGGASAHNSSWGIAQMIQGKDKPGRMSLPQFRERHEQPALPEEPPRGGGAGRTILQTLNGVGGAGSDAFAIVDTSDGVRRACWYTLGGASAIQLLAVRDFQWDVKMPQAWSGRKINRAHLDYPGGIGAGRAEFWPVQRVRYFVESAVDSAEEPEGGETPPGDN